MCGIHRVCFVFPATVGGLRDLVPGASHLNSENCYCSLSPHGFHKIAAFRLTFIQSLQWICKDDAVEKHFKPLRSDTNTTTEFNELGGGREGGRGGGVNFGHSGRTTW